jgi:hypothetical protein
MEQQTGWLDRTDKMFLLNILAVFGFLVLANLCYLVLHENIHTAICRTYGGEAKTDYSLVYMGKATTYCSGILPTTVDYLNSWVEIIGYHFQAAMNILIGWQCLKLLIDIIKSG